MLDNERHDTGSSSDGAASNGPSGLTDAPAATAAPRKRTTRRRTAKPAADSAPPETPEAAAPVAAAVTPTADAAAADTPAAAKAGAAADATGDQADGGTATRRPARRTRRSTARAAAPSENGDAGAAAASADAASAADRPAADRPAAGGPAAGSPVAGSPAAGSAPGSAGQATPPFAAPFSSPPAPFASPAGPDAGQPPAAGQQPAPAHAEPPGVPAATFQPPAVIFEPPANTSAPPATAAPARPAAAPARPAKDEARDEAAADDQAEPGEGEADGAGRRRRRRGSRTRGRGAEDDAGQDAAAADGAQATEETDAGARQGAAQAGEQDAGADDADDDDAAGGGTRRRRRKRRRGSAADADQTGPDDPPNTVVHVRKARSGDDHASDEVQVVRGSTRLEAKRQRRREGRDSGRRRPPVITESEFLARREAVDRVMVVRQRAERTQIAVLEDKVLVEHYVDRGGHQSLVGNVYLGKVQNVLPSMEAAFVDIGKGRNAVLYAGEVNFDVSGLEGQPKRIESALKAGQSVIVQVTKDPVGHKGARLTSQVSLPGRYLVYVPGASMTGISRKLPENERTRLKSILKKVTPEHAGVIVRTAAEGAAETELDLDITRLAAQWETIEKKSKTASAPALLHGEPDLTVRVIRDVFNEDFAKLIVSGDEGWEIIDEYVRFVAPHLADRISRWDNDADPADDVFAAYRIDEQLMKALERKVWLPSGGSLVIDRTEAMTVIDVNTGKFTGQGGNLEETVTRNNLEAAEEIVRQLRLRDVGGIVVIDFIDMVLESN